MKISRWVNEQLIVDDVISNFYVFLTVSRIFFFFFSFSRKKKKKKKYFHSFVSSQKVCVCVHIHTWTCNCVCKVSMNTNYETAQCIMHHEIPKKRVNKTGVGCFQLEYQKRRRHAGQYLHHLHLATYLSSSYLYQQRGAGFSTESTNIQKQKTPPQTIKNLKVDNL